MPLIADNHDAIAKLCRECRTRRLDLFVSTAIGDLDLETIDVDFIVDPGAYDNTAVERFFGLNWALEALCERHVDVIMGAQIRNRCFRDAVEAQKDASVRSGRPPGGCLMP